MTVDKLMPVLRDAVCLALGSFGFVWQVTHGAELVLMVGCIVTLSGPVVMGAWALRGSTQASESSSPPPQPAPLRPSSSPSSSGVGEP